MADRDLVAAYLRRAQGIERPQRLTLASDFVSVNDVARQLGVSRNFVVRKIHDGSMRAIRINGRYRIDRESVDSWIKDCEVVA